MIIEPPRCEGRVGPVRKGAVVTEAFCGVVSEMLGREEPTRERKRMQDRERKRQQRANNPDVRERDRVARSSPRCVRSAAVRQGGPHLHVHPASRSAPCGEPTVPLKLVTSRSSKTKNFYVRGHTSACLALTQPCPWTRFARSG
jgi:hypothetical protein